MIELEFQFRALETKDDRKNFLFMRIARLAIDKQFQGLGLGKKLSRASFQLALEMKSRYGCVGVVVDAKQESLDFYQKMGFIPLQAVANSDEVENILSEMTPAEAACLREIEI